MKKLPRPLFLKIVVLWLTCQILHTRAAVDQYEKGSIFIGLCPADVIERTLPWDKSQLTFGNPDDDWFEISYETANISEEVEYYENNTEGIFTSTFASQREKLQVKPLDNPLDYFNFSSLTWGLTINGTDFEQGALVFRAFMFSKGTELETRYELFWKVTPILARDPGNPPPVVTEGTIGDLRCGEFIHPGWPPLNITWEANCEEIPDVKTKVSFSRRKGGWYVMDMDAASVKTYKAKGPITCKIDQDSQSTCFGFPNIQIGPVYQCTPVTTTTASDTGDGEDGGGDGEDGEDGEDGDGDGEETDTASNLLQNQRVACLLVLGHLFSQML